jgi:anti-sigma factor RsiW
MKPELELKLQAWLDGELRAAEAEEMRRMAAADPEAARLLSELRNIKAAFLDNEQAAIVREPRGFYWSGIERRIQREAVARSSPGPALADWLRRWLAPLAGVAALAVVLLVALNPSAPRVFNQVSDIAAGFKSRTFREKSNGVSFGVFQENPQPTAARAFNDDSSFMTESE